MNILRPIIIYAPHHNFALTFRKFYGLLQCDIMSRQRLLCFFMSTFCRNPVPINRPILIYLRICHRFQFFTITVPVNHPRPVFPRSTFLPTSPSKDIIDSPTLILSFNVSLLCRLQNPIDRFIWRIQQIRIFQLRISIPLLRRNQVMFLCLCPIRNSPQQSRFVGAPKFVSSVNTS